MDIISFTRRPQPFNVAEEIHNLLNHKISKIDFFRFIMSQLYFHRYEQEKKEYEEHCKRGSAIEEGITDITEIKELDDFDIAEMMLTTGNFNVNDFLNK